MFLRVLRVLRALRGSTRFMESRVFQNLDTHWDPEPPAKSLTRPTATLSRGGRARDLGRVRFMESRVFQDLDTRRDHELRGDLPRRTRRPEDLCSFVSFVLFVVPLRSWRAAFSKVGTRIATLNCAGIYHEGHEDHEGQRICVPSCPSCSSCSSCSSWFDSVHGEPGFPKFGDALGP